MNVYEFVISLVVLAMIYRLVVLALRRRRPDSGTASEQPPVDEADLVREIHRGLVRMEQRIDALETLLADRMESNKAPVGEKRM